MSEDDDIEQSIATHGWHAIAVEDRPPPFLYSCGLLGRHRHPELIVFGLPSRTAHVVVDALVRLVEAGTRLAPSEHPRVLDDLELALTAVHPSRHMPYLGYAMAHARRHRVALDALQVLWPDEHGRFPFELACDIDVRTAQPRLDLPRLHR